MQFLLAQTNFY